jgi:hypothetical protein
MTMVWGSNLPRFTFEFPPDGFATLAIPATCLGSELQTLDNRHSVGHPTNGLRFAIITMRHD